MLVLTKIDLEGEFARSGPIDKCAVTLVPNANVVEDTVPNSYSPSAVLVLHTKVTSKPGSSRTITLEVIAGVDVVKHTINCSQ